MQISIKRFKAMQERIRKAEAENEVLTQANTILRNKLITSLEASDRVVSSLHKILVNTALIVKNTEKK